MEQLHVAVVLLQKKVKNPAVLFCELTVVELRIRDCLPVLVACSLLFIVMFAV